MVVLGGRFFKVHLASLEVSCVIDVVGTGVNRSMWTVRGCKNMIDTSAVPSRFRCTGSNLLTRKSNVRLSDSHNFGDSGFLGFLLCNVSCLCDLIFHILLKDDS